MFDKLHIRPAMLALAAAALAAPAAMPAMAAAPEITVKFNDLDLSTPGGQQELEARLDRAARSVCGVDSRVTGSHLPSRAASACYEETKAQLTEQFAQLVKNDNRRGG